MKNREVMEMIEKRIATHYAEIKVIASEYSLKVMEIKILEEIDLINLDRDMWSKLAAEDPCAQYEPSLMEQLFSGKVIIP